ncbi:PASTA domain-containing protein [bacterium]|nr:PASTA domain-containing protein [bacterium]
MTRRLKGMYSVHNELFRDSISRTFSATGTNEQSVLITQYAPRYTPGDLIQPLIELGERLLKVRAPHTCPLIDYHFDGTSFFCIYAGAPNLSPLIKYLRQGIPDTQRYIKWITALLKALQSLQRHGVYHGNVSLHSIHVDDHDQPVLLHTLVHDAIIRNALGKIEKLDCALFLAPEQLQGVPATIQSDIYAFGILSHLLFSNSWPFEFTTEIIRAQAYVSVPPRPFLSSVPDLGSDLGQVIGIALSKRPRDRFGSIDELSTRLIKSPPQTRTETEPPTPSVMEPPHTPDDSTQSGPDRMIRWIKQWSRRRTQIVITVGIGIMAIIVLNFVIASYVTGIPESTVPDLRGASQSEAMKRLESAHLRGKVAGVRVDYSVDAGTVLESRPPAGRAVKENRIVLLYIAKHNAEFVMPDIVGHSIEEAQSLLADSKSPITVTEEISSLSAPEGEILSQSPTPNALIGAKTPISVTISRGFPISVRGAESGTKCDLIIQLSVEPSWPAQTIKMVLKQPSGIQTIYSKTLAPGESLNLSHVVDMSGELTIYFNTRTAFHRTIKDIVASSDE